MIVLTEDPALVVDCAFCHLDSGAAVDLLHACLRERRDVQACGPCVGRMAELVMERGRMERPS